MHSKRRRGADLGREPAPVGHRRRWCSTRAAKAEFRYLFELESSRRSDPHEMVAKVCSFTSGRRPVPVGDQYVVSVIPRIPCPGEIADHVLVSEWQRLVEVFDRTVLTVADRPNQDRSERL